MKWTLSLVPKMKIPIVAENELDLSEYIDKFIDVEFISLVDVSAIGYEIDEGFVFTFDIRATLKMRCAVTLDLIDYELDVQTDEIFAYDNKEADDIYLIKNDIIDLEEAIVANVVLAIPLKVVKKGSENVFPDSKEEIKPESPFKELEGYFKK